MKEWHWMLIFLVIGFLLVVGTYPYYYPAENPYGNIELFSLGRLLLLIGFIIFCHMVAKWWRS